MFSGSYLDNDVSFLLKPIDMKFISVYEKEKLIQNKTCHYSEMLSAEYEPTKEYLDIFYQAFELNKVKFSKDILVLAENLSEKKNIVLISLVRAGTPIGVLLKRALRDIFYHDVQHYSISIIRDRGIDEVALKFILDENPNSEFIFVDGWTGKGVINRELKEFIAVFNRINNTNISDNLYVVSDIAGVADFAATNEDYLIPSSALNSTISGLVSRSILNERYIFEGDFHGCKFYNEYIEHDLSLWFVDEIMNIIAKLEPTGKKLIQKTDNKNINIDDFFLSLQEKFDVSDINYIKPGIGESTRVLLRRVPYVVLVKNIDSKNINHLKLLAEEKGVDIIEDTTLPFMALSIIKEVL